MIRLIVSGCRFYTNDKFIFDRLIRHINGRAVEIVIGDAKGVDEIALEFAKMVGLPYNEFVANWAKFDLAAGPIRNKEMAQYANLIPLPELIAFPSAKSKGTRNMIDIAYQYRINTTIIHI